jgi:hypothetical protein
VPAHWVCKGGGKSKGKAKGQAKWEIQDCGYIFLAACC